ncbi:MAG: hypothetical protein H6589_01250 [Flavobacteriales bacterium]|nr:hypothetical protein [Flavobacteriales bacterium]
MKTILIYFLLTFFSIISNNILAQDEFYSNKKEAENAVVKTDSVDFGSYSTAEDYYDVENRSVVYDNKKYAVDAVKEEEVHEETQEEKRDRRERAAFITNVVFDVFVNAVFIFATFLQ